MEYYKFFFFLLYIQFIIGRGSDASLKILHKGISRKHCTIEREGSNQWTITANVRPMSFYFS